MVDLWAGLKTFYRRKPLLILSIGYGMAVFCVYLRTLAPGVYGFDSAELTTGATTLGIVHPPGYPLYLLLGKLFTLLPIRDPAYRMNLMSAVFAAAAVPVLFMIHVRLFGSRLAASVGVGLFAFSIYTWKMAVLAEVYSLQVFLIALTLLMLIQWDQTGKDGTLTAAVVSFGFCLTNHTTSALLAPGLAAWALTSRQWTWKRPKRLAALVGLGLVPLLFYAYIPIRAGANPALNYVRAYYNVDPATFQGAFWMLSGQAYRFFAFGYPLAEIPAQVLQFLGFLSRNFLGIGILLGLVGIGSLWTRQQRLRLASLGLMFIAVAVFFINYRVLDKDTMFLPVYLIWSIFIAGGAAWVMNWVHHSAATYGGRLVGVSKAFLVFLMLAPLVLNWSWADYSSVIGPQEFAKEVLRVAPPNAEVIAEWSPAVVLEYYQVVEKMRPDVKIYNLSRSSVARFYVLWRQDVPAGQALEMIRSEQKDYILAEMKQRPVYAVNYDPDFAQNIEYLPAYNVFELRPKDSTTEQTGHQKSPPGN